MSRVMVAAVGNANDAAAWSGIPWHCIEAGRILGVVDGGLSLDTTGQSWMVQRAAFSLKSLLLDGEKGGYQFSDVFLERLFAQDRPRSDDTILNMFQLYPSKLFSTHSGPLWFYIDQTLNQLFATYGVGDRIGRRIAEDALNRERHQYHAAAGVIGQSSYAAQDVIKHYGVPAERVHVALAGANFPLAALNDWEARTARPLPPVRPLRLAFVGKDWQRKGLDRLIRGLGLARSNGANAELLTIGVDPSILPRNIAEAPRVTFAGFVDKRSDPGRFISLLSNCHIGCLLSRAEAGGISLREFHRLGLVTIAPDVGGAPEYVVAGASYLFGPDAQDDEIASVIYSLATVPGLLERQQQTAWAERHSASWDVTLRILGNIIGQPTR